MAETQSQSWLESSTEKQTTNSSFKGMDDDKPSREEMADRTKSHFEEVC